MKQINSYSKVQECPVENAISIFEIGRFLTVTGGVSDEEILSVEPGFHVDYRRSTLLPELDDEALKEALVLEFLDKQQELLTQYAIPLAPLCSWNGYDLKQWIFAASIPCPVDYQFIRYHVGERVLKEVEKPAWAPSVKFVRVPDLSVTDNEIISWEVESPPEVDIRSTVLFSNDDGQSWQPIVPPSSIHSNSVNVRFDYLPGGKARLKVLATDGFSTAIAESKPFDVPIKGIRPSILGPTEGEIVSIELLTWFHGQAYDYEKQDAAPVELVWHSSRDGELGRGAVIAVNLSPGLHEVTLTCCESSVSVSIVAQPDRRSSAISGECGSLG